MTRKKGMARRSFLRRMAAAALAAPYFVKSTAFGANDRIPAGIIGLGGPAGGGAGGTQLVAACDVREDKLARHKNNPNVTIYRDFRELLARVKAFLRRRQVKVSDVYRFGDCELNLTSHKLFRNGVEVPLTTKEFRMLEYFVQRPGRALTRNDILDAVWGSAVIVTARSVDRCVTTLRGKIEPDPAEPIHIRTIPRHGYILMSDA